MSALKRIAFYGAILILSYLFARYCIPEIEAKVLARALAAFAVISGLIQSITLAVISKLVGVAKLKVLVFWSKKRLKDQVQQRITVLKMRALLGIFCAIAIGVLSGVGFALNTIVAPLWLLFLAIFFSTCSLIFVLIAVIEYVHIHKLEVELNWSAERAASKKSHFENQEDDS